MCQQFLQEHLAAVVIIMEIVFLVLEALDNLGKAIMVALLATFQVLAQVAVVVLVLQALTVIVQLAVQVVREVQILLLELQ
jgi:hypothetical protein